MERTDLGAMGLSALAGASLWPSLGTLTLAGDGVTRTGALPPLWLLPALMLGAMVCAWAVRLRLHHSWPLTLTLLFWLPWVPFAVPPPVFVWKGPLEVGLWLVIVTGVVLARVHPRIMLRAAWIDPARAPRWVAVGFACCALAAGAALRDRLPTGDEPHYLVITQSVLSDGDLKIENNYQRGDYYDYIDQEIAPNFLRRGTDGEIYSVHAPGLAMLVLPAFALAGYPGALLLIVLLSAWGAATGWRTAFLLSGSASAAWGATAAVALSAPFFLHSFTIFPDPVGAVMVAAALCVLVKLEVTPASVRPLSWVLVGAGLATLPWLHTRLAVIAAVFGLVFAARALRTGQPTRTLAAFLAVPLASAAMWFSSFYILYGTFDPSSPYGGSRQSAMEWMPAGLAGLVFDQQAGLGANAPVFALVPVGLLALWRTRRRLALEMVVIALPYGLVVSSFGMWWAGWSAPARFLVALLPLAVPVLAGAWRDGGAALRSLFVALTVLGAANTLTRAFADGGALLYGFRDGYDLLLTWLSHTVNVPLALPSVHRLGVGGSVLLGGIWLQAGAVAFLAMQFALNGGRRSPALRWAITSWALALAMMVALGVSWLAARTAPLTPEASALAFVQRWWPDRRPVIVRLPPLRFATAEAALGDLRLRSAPRVRAVPNGAPVLALATLPAGEYRLEIDEGGAPLEGTLQVSVGTTSQTVEQWPLEGRQPGLAPFILRFPTGVHSVTIRGDERARSRLARVALRPERLETTGPVARRYALRAARYGQTQAFFLDDGFYMEPGGVWTRGNASGEVVLQHDQDGPIELDVTAGPVGTTVTMSAARDTRHLVLDAGERRRVQVAAGVWRIETAGTFRPRDFDATNSDARPLGARLEFPQ